MALHTELEIHKVAEELLGLSLDLVRKKQGLGRPAGAGGGPSRTGNRRIGGHRRTLLESGDPDCSYWEPSKPDGEGWFCLAIYDTDDGPSCWWGRRVVTP